MSLQYTLQYFYHCYWKEKKQFLRNKDQPASWIMIAVEDGQFRYRIDGCEGIASSGDLIICPESFTFERQMIQPLSFHYFIFTFQDPNDPQKAFMLDRLKHLFGYKCTPAEKNRLFNIFRHLYQLSLREDEAAIRWKNHLLNDIWFLLSLEAEELLHRSHIQHDPLMKTAKKIIDEHINEELLMKDIAVKLQLHPVQFNRRFQKVYGVSPYQYLTQTRMEMAKSMLVHTDHTIDHIGRACGYNNGFYFSRIFSKHMKMNPSEFRRIHSVPSP